MLTVRVPASTSNLGAGFDCLGLALDLWLEARLVPGEGPPDYGGTLAALDPRRDLVMRAVGPALPRGARLELHSDIPVARGLGSSAAATVAGIALRDLARNRPLDPDTIFHEASALEGHPDNVAPAVYGGLVLAAGAPRRLAVHQSLALALAIPRLEVDTREARAILPDTVSRDTAVAQAARAAALVLGLLTGNGGLVHFGMDDQLAVPRRKQLIPGFDRAARAGTAAGAFGVTISGSGSALVAVTPAGSEAAVAQAMAEALSASGNPAHPLIPAVSAQGLTVDGKALGRSGSRE